MSMAKFINETTDANLLADFIGQRDEDAFAELIRRYERLVWSVCLRILRDRGDVEDAFQTTFLLLATKAKKIRKPESLSNWLYGTAWKVASRIRKRRATVSLDDYVADGNEVSDSSESQLEAISRQYEIDLVDRHLQKMHEQHRTPLVLFYFAGYTAKQIANQLNLTVAATEGRLRRARARLRSELHAEGLQHSPLLLLGLAYSSFVSRPELISVTAERCVATGVGSIVGVSLKTLSSGTKLMICKSLCAVGISTLLAVGGFLHTDGTVDEATTIQVAEASFSDTNVVAQEFESAAAGCCVDGSCCPLQAGVAQCCNVCEEFHSHMEEFGTAVMAHAVRIHKLME